MISGLPISSKLLELLKKKLNVGNLRSIQLNCVPGKRKTRLDITDTREINESLPEDFLEKLFNQKEKFTYPISFGNLNLNLDSDNEKQKALGILSTRLNRLNDLNNEDQQEYGYESFGFGFPVVVFRPQKDPDKLIRAPLFIWHFSIKKNRSKTNTWEISRSLNQEIEFNNLLRSYLGELSDVKIEGFNEEELKDGVLDFDELIENTITFIKKFDKSSVEGLDQSLRESFENGLEPIPPTNKLQETATSIPRVYWGGVFGQFDQRNEAIRQEMREQMFELLEELDEEDQELKAEALMHSETAAKTDPSQLGILNYLKENKHVVIQGPPGTGKSESITGIIINALEHQKTCLVVCEKKTAMEVLKENLHEVDPEIGRLAAQIEDVATDRKSVVNSVRDRYEQHGSKVHETPSSSNLTEKLEFIEVKIRDIERRKKYLSETEVIKSSDHKGWTNAVGKQLKAKYANGDLSIKEILSSKSINIEEIEYQKDLNFLKGFKKRSESLDYKNTLWFLPDYKIEEGNSISIKDDLSPLLVSKTERFKKFITVFEEHIDEKKKKIDQEVDRRIDKLNKLSIKLSSIYDIVKGQSVFQKNNWWFKTVKTARSLSVNLKKQVESFLEVPSLVNELNEQLSTLRIDVELNREEHSIEVLKSNLKLINDSLNNLKEHRSTLKKELFNDLKNKDFCGIKIDSKLLKGFRKCKGDCKSFYQEISKEGNGLNFEELNKSVELLRWYLKCSKNFNLAVEQGFFDHFEWQQNFRAQNSSIQKIISVFLEQGVSNWEMQFKEFYINEKLKENFSDLTGGYESQLEQLKDDRKQLIGKIEKRIPRYWKAKQTQVNQKVNIRKLYNKRGSKGSRRNSLRKIAKRSLESLTSYFPVMMVSPSACASIFDLEPNLFDYVIFDEASQLKTEESLSTLIRGKRKVVSGDDKQMPPAYWFTKVNTEELEIDDEQDFDPYQSLNEELESAEGARDLANSESLLHFAELCNFKSYHLDFHYRSHHPLLIEFSNAAFYKSRLNPLPEKINQSPIQFIPVNGINHNQQNKDEANSAVEILKNLKRDEDGKLPTVGIATFNKKQKNLVWDILKRETQTDEDFNRKFREFEENGFFVKNLENIQGDERDVIILSTTYGKGRDGSFSRRYGPLNTSKLGRRLLNVIITRAKKKIFVLTSVPKEYYMDYRQELDKEHEKERGYFHAYLAYAKAVSDGDRESIESVLGFFKNRNRATKGSNNLTESPFEEAVYQALQTKIEDERITLQHWSGGFRIDMTIKSKKTGREYIAIECDGATYHGSAEDHAWDMYRQDILEDNGFVFHRIWSRDWWENSERELERVVNFIHQQDEKDPGDELFDDPAAEDVELSSLLEEAGLFIEEEPKDEKETIEETASSKEDKEKPKKKEAFKKDDQQIQIDYKSSTRPLIEIGQVVKLKYLDEGREIKIKLSKNVSDSKQKNGVTILDEKSPVGQAILGERVGDTVEVGGVERYCKILSIN